MWSEGSLIIKISGLQDGLIVMLFFFLSFMQLWGPLESSSPSTSCKNGVDMCWLGLPRILSPSLLLGPLVALLLHMIGGGLWFIAFCLSAHWHDQSQWQSRRAASLADDDHVQKTSKSYHGPGWKTSIHINTELGLHVISSIHLPFSTVTEALLISWIHSDLSCSWKWPCAQVLVSEC